MSQRNSGYERKPRDLYETPEWVTREVINYIPAHPIIWEPACGSCRMVKALMPYYNTVFATDIHETNQDFLNITELIDPRIRMIITNPPYGSEAPKFIRHAINLMAPVKGTVAMLLKSEFDTATSRKDLFKDSPYFDTKLVLTKRIVWFEPPIAQPSSNHAWYIWKCDDTEREAKIIYT